MDRDLAEWARAFTWDTRRTITQTYEERISQSMGFAEQFQQGFSREQFTNYLNTIEAQATFMSFLDPITAFITPKLIFFGSLCSVTICCFMGIMSLHWAYRYIQQSCLAKVTVSIVTVLKLMCCAPATILADKMYRHTLAASFDNDYRHISERRRFDKQRKERSPPESQPFEETIENQTETVYAEPTPDPTREQLELQQNLSAPMCGFKAHISNQRKVRGFVLDKHPYPNLGFNHETPIHTTNPFFLGIVFMMSRIITSVSLNNTHLTPIVRKN